MSQESILLTPGPVPLHPKVREVLAEPAEHHRTPQFATTFAQVLSRLPDIFQSSTHPMCLTSTGSGAMEAVILNAFSPGDEVLCVVGGKFGERWYKMAQVYGLKAIALEVPWGEAASLEAIQTALKANPNYKALLIQACETSTATAHPIEAIGSYLKKEYPNLLFVVDAITALGAYPLKMDEWGIDALIGGSQKAFMLPTGMSFICFSEKAWKAHETSTLPKFYFDLGLEKKANESGQTHFSTPTHLIKALNVVLDIISEKGLESYFSEIQRRFDFTHYIIGELGLKAFSRCPSISVTAIEVPESIDGKKWRADLEKKYGLILMGGQDQLTGKIIRVGHMGYITNEDLTEFTKRIAQSLTDYTYLKQTPEHFVNLAKKWLSEH